MDGLDLEYCNGHRSYERYGGSPGFDTKDFRRGYVAALFTANKHYLTAIEKYQMLVPGTRKNKRDAARDLAVKEYLQEQVSPYTYEDRKTFFEAWKNALCCADDCKDYCDTCSNKGIKFKPTPTFGLDLDVRRYITRYGRYQTTSEKEKEDARDKESTDTILSGVCDRKSNDDPVRIRGQKRDGLPGQPEEVSSDQAERIEAMLSHPISEEMVT